MSDAADLEREVELLLKKVREGHIRRLLYIGDVAGERQVLCLSRGYLQSPQLAQAAAEHAAAKLREYAMAYAIGAKKVPPLVAPGLDRVMAADRDR